MSGGAVPRSTRLPERAALAVNAVVAEVIRRRRQCGEPNPRVSDSEAIRIACETYLDQTLECD